MPLPIRRNNGLNEDAFVTWGNDQEKKAAFREMGKALNKVEAVYHTRGALGDQFRGVDSNMSIRAPFTRLDYEYFRPTEQIPKLQKNIIGTCMHAYDRIGMVKNVIDLMADFACQGIRLTHRNKSIEQFYQAWWKQIGGQERSERFLNMFYRSANVIIKRSTAILNEETIQEFKRTVGDTIAPLDNFQDNQFYTSEPNQPDLELTEPFTPGPKEIPWRYTVLNPLTLNMLGDDLTAFTGDPFYSMSIPMKVYNIINSPRNDVEKKLVDSIPADIVKHVKNGKRHIPLDPMKTISMFYKKDDWLVWANPMLYSILDDLILLEKMKLADLTALDGAIHHIRIWKLGNLAEKILPTDAAIAKLSDILLNNVGGGSMDLIWGPDLELSETSTDVQAFLGSEKYGPVLLSICAGLGIPQQMGSSEKSGSFTHNFISLKTLVERLTYGRNALNAMWAKEISIVQKAMNFRYPADILYDNMVLSDDASEKALWIQLWDRNLASDETVQEKFGQIPEVEQNRIQREFQQREEGTRPEKASPFVDAQPQLSKDKIALQRGLMDIDGKKLPQVPPGTPKGQPQQGRPRTSKDKAKRKKRIVKPNSKAELFIDMSLWANNVQKDLAEIINPIFITKAGKKDLRGLSTDQTKELERFKFTLLYNLEPFIDITESSLATILSQSVLVYNQVDELKESLMNKYISLRGNLPSPDEIKQIQSYVYTIFKGEFDGDNTSDG